MNSRNSSQPDTRSSERDSIEKFFLDNRAGHRIEQRHVRARLQRQMNVRVMRQLDFARIDDDQFRAAQNRLLDARADDRMVFRRVGPAEEKCARLLDIIERIRSRAGAEHRFHRRGGRRMTDARATIHIVCAENNAREFLREIIVLVRPARRAEHAHAVGAVRS